VQAFLVEHDAAAVAHSSRAQGAGRPGAAASFGDLQHLGGNAAVTALLGGGAAPLPVQRSGCAGGCGCGGACGGQPEHEEPPVQRAPAGYALDPRSLLALQRMAGNASVGLLVQRSMAVSQPGDAVEREAEAVAEAIGGATVGVQRKGIGGTCESAPSDDDSQAIAGEEPADEGTAMAMASGSRVEPLDPEGEAALAASRGAGFALADDVRSHMEPRFRADFSGVRVHTDAVADRLSRRMGAEAFTTGADLYFRAGRYAPATGDGRRLIAHELTHVVQQRRAGPPPAINRFTLSGFPATEQAAMNAAIPKAEAGVKSCKPKATCVASAITSKTYKYAPDLGLCGWTYPLAGTIKIGKDAFSTQTCCDLESTIAHEASHTCFYTEGGARKLECDCFACSCDAGKSSMQAPEGGDTGGMASNDSGGAGGGGGGDSSSV
jgi:hypothetical protein